MSVDMPAARSDDLLDVLASDEAFQAWYGRALPRVYGYLLARCGHDAELAEELTQQAFAEAVRDRRGLRAATDPTAWLVGIARHRASRRRAERQRLHDRFREPVFVHHVGEHVITAGGERREARREREGVDRDRMQVGERRVAYELDARTASRISSSGLFPCSRPIR